MALDTRFVRGINSGIFVSEPFPAGVRATRPETVILEVTAAAAAGALVLTLTSSVATTLRANQVLTFNAGQPDAVQVLVTEDTPVTAAGGPVPVDAVEGDEGVGIPAAIAEDSVAEWDGMFRVLSTAGSSMNVTEGTSDLQSVTYDSSQAMAWDETAITSKGWNMPRSGRFKPHDHALQCVQIANIEGREVWVKRTLADEAGLTAQVQEGRSHITAYSDDAPADGMVDVGWTFAGQGRPVITRVSAA